MIGGGDAQELPLLGELLDACWGEGDDSIPVSLEIDVRLANIDDVPNPIVPAEAGPRNKGETLIETRTWCEPGRRDMCVDCGRVLVSK